MLVVLAVILAGIVAAYEYAQTKPPTIVFTTKAVPILAPHEHDSHINTVNEIGHGVEVLSPIFTPEEDVWVTGFDYETVNAPSLVLHHAMLSNATSSRIWCSDKPDSRFFTIITEDQMHDPHVRFPPGYALRIPAGTPVLLYAMFHNAQPPMGSGETYTDVYGKITLHVRAASDEPFKELTYYAPHLADDACLPNDYGYLFSIPANVTNYHVTGSNSKKHSELASFERPVTIKYWGAHVHGWQGGKSLIVKKNDEIIQTFATQPANSNPYEFITPYGPTDVRLNAGDTLSLEAVYDNLTDEPQVGAMGILYMYVHEE